MDPEAPPLPRSPPRRFRSTNYHPSSQRQASFDAFSSAFAQPIFLESYFPGSGTNPSHSGTHSPTRNHSPRKTWRGQSPNLIATPALVKVDMNVAAEVYPAKICTAQLPNSDTPTLAKADMNAEEEVDARKTWRGRSPTPDYNNLIASAAFAEVDKIVEIYPMCSEKTWKQRSPTSGSDGLIATPVFAQVAVEADCKKSVHFVFGGARTNAIGDESLPSWPDAVAAAAALAARLDIHNVHISKGLGLRTFYRMVGGVGCFDAIVGCDVVDDDSSLGSISYPSTPALDDRRLLLPSVVIQDPGALSDFGDLHITASALAFPLSPQKLKGVKDRMLD